MLASAGRGTGGVESARGGTRPDRTGQDRAEQSRRGEARSNGVKCVRVFEIAMDV